MPKRTKNLRAPFLKQTDIFTSGEEGYHTYRIPALIVSTEATVLAFCEGRKHSSDDFGDIDIVLRRSFDRGDTWESMQIVADDGSNTMGNPSPVVDRDTDAICLVFCRNNEQVYVIRSTDDGVSWSTPVEITEDVKDDGWDRYGTGPCHGIQLNSGELVVPCWHTLKGFGDGPDGSYSHIIYSNDHGSTWQLGGTVGPYLDECTVIERSDGSLYLNVRRYPPKGGRLHVRAYAYSKDDGMTWSRVRFDHKLIDPICQASAIRFTDKNSHDKNRVLFSNPAHREKRMNMTVRLSYDECQTWSVSKVLSHGPSAYSDLAIAPDMSICCLFERGEENPYEKLTYARFNVEWLTEGTDHVI